MIIKIYLAHLIGKLVAPFVQLVAVSDRLLAVLGLLHDELDPLRRVPDPPPVVPLARPSIDITNWKKIK